jgi:hypothetical protein
MDVLRIEQILSNRSCDREAEEHGPGNLNGGTQKES